MKRSIWAIVGLVLVDIIVGVGVYLLSSNFTEEPDVQIFAGIIAAVFSAVIGTKWLLYRVEESASISRLTSRLIDLGFREDVLDDEILKNMLRASLVYFRRQEELSDDVRDFIDDSIGQTNRMMETIGRGYARVELEDIRKHGMRIVDSATKGEECIATSYISTSVWWDSPQGQDYLKRKLNAAARGVVVSQIFIASSKEEILAAKWIFEQVTNKEISGKGTRVHLYAINKKYLITDECVDMLLLKKRSAFELILPDIDPLDERKPSWINGFYLYVPPSNKISELEQYFDRLLDKPELIKYNAAEYADFNDFVQAVLK